VPDLLRRDFTAPAPNQRYVGDITYLPLADGTNLYLATVIDCYSRRLAGWAVADHMRTSLVEDALKAAAGTRGNLAGAVFHSDHGSVGEFNRSSQHLDLEVLDGKEAAGCRSCAASEDAFAGQVGFPVAG
jgi:transposase InsO family protein